MILMTFLVAFTVVIGLLVVGMAIRAGEYDRDRLGEDDE